MNTFNENGNSQIPKLVIDDGESAESILQKVNEYNSEIEKWGGEVISQKSQLYERLKKAEGFEFKDNKWVKPEDGKKNESKNELSLSPADIIAIQNSKVHPEDLEEITEYAKYKNIPLREALNSNYVQNFVKENNEKRTSAEVANTGKSVTSTTRISDEELVSKASRGELPTSEEDMKRLATLSLKRK